MLDASVRVEILELLRHLQSAHRLAVIYITHDLSAVRHFSERIFVMYGGRVVEKAPVANLLHNPLHPYTRALLSAIPEGRRKATTRRIILRGETTSPIDPPAYCRFANRCFRTLERCRAEDPALQATDVRGHLAACFNPCENGSGGGDDASRYMHALP
jgi:peptide/nickel transport system ATP-binding protein